MDNILDVLFSYSKEHKFLDKKGLLKIIDILIDEFEIELIDEKIIYETEYTDTKDPTLAEYFQNDVTIYLGRMQKMLEEESESLYIDTTTLSQFEIYLMNNLYIIKTVLHELIHALQEQLMILNKDHSLERTLTNLELAHINEMNSYYDDDRHQYEQMAFKYNLFYEKSFIERIADIESQEYAIKLLEKVRNEQRRLLELEQVLLLHTQMFTYRKPYFSPTINFFEHIGKYRELENLNFYGHDYKTRLRLGLELTEEEYTRNKLILSEKRIKN